MTDPLYDGRNPNHGRTGGLRDPDPRSSAGSVDAERLRWEALESSGHNKLARQMFLQAAEELEKLQDPVAVHINMLSGRIAKPTWAHIKHLYPEQFPDVAQPMRMAGGDWAQLLTLRDVMKTAYKRGGERLMSVWERDLNAIEAAITILDKAAQPPADAGKTDQVGEAMALLGDVPGETLVDRVNKLISYHLGLQSLLEEERAQHSSAGSDNRLDPLAMLLDAARFIEMEKPAWAKAAREAVAHARAQPQTLSTYTEICMNEKCPRGGIPVEVVRSSLSRPESK